MRKPNHGLLLIGLSGFALQTGCMTYKQIEPADVVDYGEILIATTDGREEFLWEPQIRMDTLIGLRASGDTLRIPLERLQIVEASKTDAVKTVGLIVGIGAVVGAVWFAAAMVLMVNDLTDS